MCSKRHGATPADRLSSASVAIASETDSVWVSDTPLSGASHRDKGIVKGVRWAEVAPARAAHAALDHLG
jgi:hypothetical protein